MIGMRSRSQSLPLLLLLLCGLLGCLAASTHHTTVAAAASQCQCGSFTYPDPSNVIQPTAYTKGVDYPGNDMAPCGPQGCAWANVTTPTDCLNLCNVTSGCVAYIFSAAGCDTPRNAATCWLKSTVGLKDKNACRNAQIIKPIETGPYCALTTEWTSNVDPSKRTPLPEYPRPQLVRDTTWVNLNGLWEFQASNSSDHATIPFGQPLAGQVNVPFPIEACLSGVWQNHMHMTYRREIVSPLEASATSSSRVLLHFGAVDWQTSVFVNGTFVGNHTGGYDGFSFDITKFLAPAPAKNELIVAVFDPSDYGQQVFGKQRISAITSPGGDTYSPSSGIWQTVWLEVVNETFIRDIKITPTLSTASLTVNANDDGTYPITFKVMDGTTVVASGQGSSGVTLDIPIPNPKLWSPTSPFLYNLTITMQGDSVTSYFGLRTFTLGKDDKNITRPMLNGEFIFLVGWLDQSYWPDGLYTAPTDAALAYDLQAAVMFGMNMVRLHQKVNSERWYYYTDTLGLIVFQDMVQHYGDAHGITPSQDLYMADLTAMINGRYNHPSIVQYETFNEEDMYKHFDVPKVVEYAKALDPSRLVDTDSGGGANNLFIGDVNDVHTYPYPKAPGSSDTQYGMIGEYGGLGAFVEGHMWWPRGCYAYLPTGTPAKQAEIYQQMIQTVQEDSDKVSAIVYTQVTDIEFECDGFLNYDRTNKFNETETAAIRKANKDLIASTTSK